MAIHCPEHGIAPFEGFQRGTRRVAASDLILARKAEDLPQASAEEVKQENMAQDLFARLGTERKSKESEFRNLSKLRYEERNRKAHFILVSLFWSIHHQPIQVPASAPIIFRKVILPSPLFLSPVQQRQHTIRAPSSRLGPVSQTSDASPLDQLRWLHSPRTPQHFFKIINSFNLHVNSHCSNAIIGHPLGPDPRSLAASFSSFSVAVS